MSELRENRVGRQLKRELGHLIQSEVKDPAIRSIIVTSVKMSKDLHVAKVYVSISGTAARKERVLRRLERAKGYLRSLIGGRIALRHTPELVFILDESLEYAEHISDLLHRLPPRDEEKGSVDHGELG
jgi:ribosome-binding factor A